jgi:cysteinyl-tRNA synthetase
MDDDFNSREAVAKVLGAVREISKTLSSGLDDRDKDAFAHYSVDWLEETAGSVLGILPSREFALLEPEEDPRKEQITSQVEALLVERAKARETKDWAKADQIRDQLTEMGVIIIDSADGPTWDLV